MGGEGRGGGGLGEGAQGRENLSAVGKILAELTKKKVSKHSTFCLGFVHPGGLPKGLA